jgi:hypothetical protein
VERESLVEPCDAMRLSNQTIVLNIRAAPRRPSSAHDRPKKTATTGVREGIQQLRQGDVRLLETDLAQQLLRSSIPARLAFVWTDGTPRVVPTWFHWNGREIVMVT